MCLLIFLLIAAMPSPQYPEARHTKAATDQHHTYPRPISTVSDHASSKSTPKPGDNYTYNYYYPTAPSQSPPVLFQEITTVVLILFTGGLWLTSIWQWCAIKDQAEIANQTLLLSNRPRIKLRTFVIKPSNCFQWNMPIDIECQVVNWDGTDAYIIESNCTIFINRPEAPVDELPMWPLYSDQVDSFKVTNGVLLAGLACPMYQLSNATICTPTRSASGGQSLVPDLYALGYILYRGKRGNFYRTAFCRRFDFSKRRFVTVENSDYEHED
jgi:hypothetical protein